MLFGQKIFVSAINVPTAPTVRSSILKPNWLRGWDFRWYPM
jgi:hypothetical protein